MSGFEVEKESNFCRIYRLSSSACQLASLSALLGWAVLFKEDGTDLAASFGLLLSSKVGLVVQATAVTLAAIYACRKSGLSKCRFKQDRWVGVSGGNSSSLGKKPDFTKGTLLRRTVQRIKYWGQKLSPLKTLVKLAGVFLAGVVVVLYFSFCFGAPLDFEPFVTSGQPQSTLSFSVLLAIYAALPALVTFGAETLDSSGLVQVFLNHGLDERELGAGGESCGGGGSVAQLLLWNALGAIVGAWAGALPIPLDWDRPWQTWPVTCSIGCVLGATLSGIVALFFSTPRFPLIDGIKARSETSAPKNKKRL